MYRNQRSNGPDVPPLFWALVAVVTLVVVGFLVVLILVLPAPEKGAPPMTSISLPEEEYPAAEAVPTPVPATPAPTPTATPMDPAESLYQTVYDQVDGLEQTLTFTAEGLTQEQVEDVLARIQRRPEFFWLDGYVYYARGDDYEVDCNWKYEDPAACRTQVEEAAAQALAAIPEGAGDYEKALSLHDWLCDHIVYEHSEDGSDQDLYGALVLNRCVCAGYCAAYEYLLNQAGIQVETVRGQADNGTGVESHAWTKLVLEGEIYYTDVTWDDQQEHPNGYNYSWFAVTSDRMAATHFADPTLGAEMTPSSATACNYHYRNGWVLESYNTDDLVRILASQQGGSLTLLAGDDQVYQQVLALLQDGEAAISVLEQAGHPADRYTYYIAEGDLTIDIFPVS